MKKILLGVMILTTSSLSFGQIIFDIQAPAAIEGDVPFTSNGDGSNWGLVNLDDPADAVTDTLALALGDVTPLPPDNTVPLDEEVCNAVTNDVAGKIAVIYRGNCAFGTKALNAQDAGAVAVVIINHSPGLINMDGTAGIGTDVTIPVAFIDDATGAAIRAQIDGGEDVVAFIGNKTGIFANDIGGYAGDVLRSPLGVVPSYTATNGTDFNFQVGAWAYNYGFNDQSSVTLTATVTDPSGANVYTETSGATSIVSGDTVPISLPDFVLSSYPVGKYRMDYYYSLGGADDYDADNQVTNYFSISDTDLSLATPNDTSDVPIANSNFRVSHTNVNDANFNHCMHYRSPIASRMKVDGISFSASGGIDSTLTDEFVEVFLYEWTDAFTDMNDAALNNTVTNITPVATGEYDYVSDLEGVTVFAELRNNQNEKIVLSDNTRYLFCVANFNVVEGEEVFFGYQSNVDYTLNLNTYLQPISPIQDGSTWNATGFGWTPVPTLSVKVEPVTVGLNENVSTTITAYPNPANDNIIIPINGMDGNITINVMDIAGNLVESKSNNVSAGKQRLSYDVSNLANGNYVFSVIHSDGVGTFKMAIAR